MNKTRLLIWGTASVTAGTALYALFPTHWTYWWHTIQLWVQEGYPFKKFPFWVLPATIFFDLILLFKLIASFGMFRLQRWGRILAIYVLSANFLVELAGFINVQTYYWRHPEMVQRHKEMLESALSRGYVQVTTISAIPGYIIGLLSLISVIILIMRPVKEGFGAKKMSTKINTKKAMWTLLAIFCSLLVLFIMLFVFAPLMSKLFILVLHLRTLTEFLIIDAIISFCISTAVFLALISIKRIYNIFAVVFCVVFLFLFWGIESSFFWKGFNPMYPLWYEVNMALNDTVAAIVAVLVYKLINPPPQLTSGK